MQREVFCFLLERVEEGHGDKKGRHVLALMDREQTPACGRALLRRRETESSREKSEKRNERPEMGWIS